MFEDRVFDEAVALRHGEELRAQRAEDSVHKRIEVGLDCLEGDFKRKRHRTGASGRREKAGFRAP